METNSHPRLRSIETIFVLHDAFGRALMLRDGEGIAPTALAIRGDLAPVVMSMDGTRSIDALARQASSIAGQTIDAAVVRQLVAELDAAYFLDSPRYLERRREVVAAFKSRSERPAQHAGSAYHADPKALRRFIENDCLAKAARVARRPRMVGLCAPHMDLWRASVGYGHAYAALSESLPDEVDTIFVLGTSHMPMRQPFAVCDKPFATPLGAMSPDREAIAWLASRARFDVKEDEYLHKGEHSLEFQIVFLRHLLGARPVRIVPILCGLGRVISAAQEPSRDAATESFLVALRELVERRRERSFVVMGADLAHVGPRFGDARPLHAPERDALAKRDHESITRMVERDARGFYFHVREDLHARRVCGLGPIYTALRVLPEGTMGEVLHYDQCVDPQEGSIVSHASVGFYR
ncbi:MAG: AmmeMemoRadiSam system protein B [Polyangiaceae bacterium]|nr:AmmeMemoRadiSam system protein B [Polyangiaceae bacterium]